MWPFSRGSDDDLPSALSTLRPWRDGLSPVLSHIRAHTEPETLELRTSGHDLPDEEVDPASSVRFAPGARDGVFGSGNVEEQASVAKAIQAALGALVSGPNQQRARSLYSLMMEHGALSVADVLMPRIIETWEIPAARVRDVALWMLTGSPDREPVKYAIAMLGVSGTDADADLMLTLGSHEEFTLFASVALLHSADEPERRLWELAKRVRGWGRIHIIRRLSETRDEEIRRWMITDGCFNSVMSEYTALLSAKSGGLVEALGEDGAHADAKLMDGASEILEALCRDEGPAESISSYEEGERALGLFLDCTLRAARPSLRQLSAVVGIKRCLEDPKVDWKEGGLESWAPGSRIGLAGRCGEVLAQPVSREVIEESLGSEVDFTFHTAAGLAAAFGLDVWERRFERAERGGDQWYWLMQTTDRGRIDRVVELARSVLPLQRLKGPPTERILATGPDALHHLALDWAVSYLKPFPGAGWDLVKTALESPFSRNRNMALATIDAWPREQWPKDARSELIAAGKRACDDEYRRRVQEVLARESAPRQSRGIG